MREMDLMDVTEMQHMLQLYADDFLLREYGIKETIEIYIEEFQMPTEFLGLFEYSEDGEDVGIYINGQLCEYGRLFEVLDVLRHELVHYAMYKQEKKFDDGEEDFENELSRLRVSPTGMDYASNLPQHTYLNKDGKTVHNINFVQEDDFEDVGYIKYLGRYQLAD